MFELYVVLHGNESSFRGMLSIYYRVPLNQLYCCRISGRAQPSSMSQITRDLDNVLTLFRTTRGLEPPEWKGKYLYKLLS
jgi:hypothetical protein